MVVNGISASEAYASNRLVSLPAALLNVVLQGRSTGGHLHEAMPDSLFNLICDSGGYKWFV